MKVSKSKYFFILFVIFLICSCRELNILYVKYKNEKYKKFEKKVQREKVKFNFLAHYIFIFVNPSIEVVTFLVVKCENESENVIEISGKDIRLKSKYFEYYGYAREEQILRIHPDEEEFIVIEGWGKLNENLPNKTYEKLPSDEEITILLSQKLKNIMEIEDTLYLIP